MSLINEQKPDANELFRDMLNALHCSIEPYEDEENKGYRIYDEALGEYRSFEGMDVVVSEPCFIVDELSTYIDDSFYNDLAEELESAGLVYKSEELPLMYDKFYEHIVRLAEESDKGAQFWKDHKFELDVIELVVYRIDEVDLNVVCPKAIEQSQNKSQIERG